MVKNASRILNVLLTEYGPRVEQENAKEVLKYIRSLWVDAKAAGCIPSARNNKSFIAMNGRFVGQLYIERYTERAWPME